MFLYVYRGTVRYVLRETSILQLVPHGFWGPADMAIQVQIFITASVTLRIQVAKAFRKLQAAVIGIAQADELEAASAREHPSFANIPDEAFPLFLSTR